SITSWMPLFLFVVLFGLSMDYHVFILSRIREAFDRGSSTEEAVAHGIKSTAGVVTSAAVVMVSVFAIFATLSLVIFKQLGVGLIAFLAAGIWMRGPSRPPPRPRPYGIASYSFSALSSFPPNIDAKPPVAVFWRPPPTHEVPPVRARFRAPPLTDEMKPASLSWPPLMDESNPLATLCWPPLADAPSP